MNLRLPKISLVKDVKVICLKFPTGF